MPAFVDWNSLLFGSSTGVQTTDQVASHTELDASLPESLENWNAPPGSAIPEAAFIKGERGRRNDRERGGENVRRGSEDERRGASERAVPDNAIPESGILGSAIPGFASESSASQRAIDWIAGAHSIDHQFAVTAAAAVAVGAFFLWLLFGRRKRSFAPFQRLTAGEKVLDSLLDALKQEFAQKTEDFETQLNQALKQQADVLEAQYQQALKEQSDAVEEQVRKSLNKRVETLEVRIKLDQEALNDVHRVLSERMEAFENYVRTIDSKNLDQEANSIAQHTLSQRLDAVEEGSRNIDSKARSLSQRIEAIDDSVRVIDSRAKALSQRVEAAEDNLNSTDGQVTLLSHDVNRGSSVLEKLQRHVKMLPDSEKFKGLSRSWEAKLKKLETKIDETEKAIEEHLAEPPPSLSWSHIESVEIEPSGPIYTRPYDMSFDGSVVSPSSSIRSYCTSDSHARTYSTVSSSPHPMTPERRRIDSAGFRETTFSSRQKLLAHRGESWSN